MTSAPDSPPSSPAGKPLLAILRWMQRRQLDQIDAIQCFLTGGVTAVASLVTLFLLRHTVATSWQDEALGLLVLLVLITGLALMALGYLGILVIRLGRFLLESESPDEGSSGPISHP